VGSFGRRALVAERASGPSRIRGRPRRGRGAPTRAFAGLLVLHV